MSGARLIRLVETGEVIDGIELVEPQEVQPLTLEHIEKIWEEWHASAEHPVDLVRAVEQAHGIGRRLDA